MYKDRRDHPSGSKRSAVFPADGNGSRSEMPSLLRETPPLVRRPTRKKTKHDARASQDHEDDDFEREEIVFDVIEVRVVNRVGYHTRANT